MLRYEMPAFGQLDPTSRLSSCSLEQYMEHCWLQLQHTGSTALCADLQNHSGSAASMSRKLHFLIIKTHSSSDRLDATGVHHQDSFAVSGS